MSIFAKAFLFYSANLAPADVVIFLFVLLLL